MTSDSPPAFFSRLGTTLRAFWRLLVQFWKESREMDKDKESL